VRFQRNENIARIKHIFTIHNLVYQGEYDKQVLFDYLAFEYRYFEDGSLRFDDHCNFMKAALIFADKITTVSATYAKEIQTPEFGYKLDTVLKYRQNDLIGIVNGIDTVSFDPKTDPDIQFHYSLHNYLKGKAENKKALQYTLGLEEKPDVLLIGMVSRLTFQKGADLVLQALSEILQTKVQVAILGTGESKYEYSFRMLEEGNKGRCVYYCGYNEALAHKMYAGLDLLLMPSLFEPCGLSQLISMRYGTLPLVRETGGLKDTVEPYNEYTDTGRGFSFGPYSAWDLLQVFRYASRQYYEYPKNWKGLVKRAMQYDVSFDTSAREYEKVYRQVLGL
jgi:starch synthase